MYVGKYLIFIVGMSAGIGSMFAFSHYNSNNSTKPSVPLPETASSLEADASPFAVVEEVDTAKRSVELTVDASGGNTDVLIQRIEDAESRIELLETELAEVQSQLLPPESPTGKGQAELLSSVFEPATASQIQEIRDDAQLQRLELRDRAIREGWINTDRFRDESRALRSGSELREALGDEGYDKLLVAEGRDNRVRIESVIENSAAHLSGIEEGDLIIRYADNRIFQFPDLRDGTTGGERNESVTVQVSRDGELIDLVIPRGPMGVTLTGATEQPSP